jgi:hypothetical protein
MPILELKYVVFIDVLIFCIKEVFGHVLLEEKHWSFEISSLQFLCPKITLISAVPVHDGPPVAALMTRTERLEAVELGLKALHEKLEAGRGLTQPEELKLYLLRGEAAKRVKSGITKFGEWD